MQMTNMRHLVFVFALAASTGSYALAQTAPVPGDTSGPAVGKPVSPPTAVEKTNPHVRPTDPQGGLGASGASAGAPGVEGKADTQSGKAPGGTGR
jgi:hypothetical protein